MGYISKPISIVKDVSEKISKYIDDHSIEYPKKEEFSGFQDPFILINLLRNPSLNKLNTTEAKELRRMVIDRLFNISTGKLNSNYICKYCQEI